jgi:hypothetical protein
MPTIQTAGVGVLEEGVDARRAAQFEQVGYGKRG